MGDTVNSKFFNEKQVLLCSHVKMREACVYTVNILARHANRGKCGYTVRRLKPETCHLTVWVYSATTYAGHPSHRSKYIQSITSLRLFEYCQQFPIYVERGCGCAEQPIRLRSHVRSGQWQAGTQLHTC